MSAAGVDVSPAAPVLASAPVESNMKHTSNFKKKMIKNMSTCFDLPSPNVLVTSVEITDCTGLSL